jgi:hypothetical protein
MVMILSECVGEEGRYLARMDVERMGQVVVEREAREPALGSSPCRQRPSRQDSVLCLMQLLSSGTSSRERQLAQRLSITVKFAELNAIGPSLFSFPATSTRISAPSPAS